MSKPTLIFAPGAWHTPQAFEKIIPKLEAEGFTCQGIEFPSVFKVPVVTSLEPDIEAIRKAVSMASDAGHDVVIVCHSWAGKPVNSALQGLSKKECVAKGERGGVVKIIYIAAFLVPEGVSIFDAVGRTFPPLWNVQGDVTLANDPKHYFYADLKAEEAEYYASMLKPHALATKYSKTAGEPWKVIRSAYLVCEKDNAIPIVAQEGMVKAAEDAGASIEVERIDASHSPFLSKPDAVVNFILRSVGSSS